MKSRLKDYVNKPLVHFDDLGIIIGDDFANEECKKDVYERFRTIPFAYPLQSTITDGGGIGASFHFFFFG